MKVKELITKLNKIKDKNKVINIDLTVMHDQPTEISSCVGFTSLIEEIKEKQIVSLKGSIDCDLYGNERSKK